MRIGIMLRHMDQHLGGVRIYTQNLLSQLFALDSPHEFVVMYRDPGHIGAFGDRARVREVALRAPNILAWDQVVVPYLERRERLDVIFNPKSTVPVLSKSPTVFVCHGLSKSVLPRSDRWASTMHHKYVMPAYVKKAGAIIAISDVVKQGLVQHFGVAADRIHTVHHGADDLFRRPPENGRLEATKAAHDLPDRFFLYCGQIYPPKNFGRLLRAYAKVGPPAGISLVVAGAHWWRGEGDIALVDELGISQWVKWVGWIEHDVLPDFYQLAQALLIPSLYESCGIPILEALCAGCPVVTSDRFGTAEMAGDAAVLVNPEDVDDIADGIRRIVDDPDLRRRVVERGRERSGHFTWKRCAIETLQVLESVAGPPPMDTPAART